MKRGRPKGLSRDKKSYGPLGDLIRKYRMERKLGLAEVAKACKCSVQFISNIEHGRAPLPWDKAQQLANVLQIPAAELQAANLAIRSDFQSFFDSSTAGSATNGRASGGRGRRTVKKSQTALAGLKDAASLVAMTARDAQLRDLLQHYSSASSQARKRFVQSAKRLLSDS